MAWAKATVTRVLHRRGLASLRLVVKEVRVHTMWNHCAGSSYRPPSCLRLLRCFYSHHHLLSRVPRAGCRFCRSSCFTQCHVGRFAVSFQGATGGTWKRGSPISLGGSKGCEHARGGQWCRRRNQRGRGSQELEAVRRGKLFRLLWQGEPQQRGRHAAALMTGERMVV